MKIEEQFTYASVNALDSVPQMRARRPVPIPPSVKDTVHYRDSVIAVREKEECASTGQRSIRTDRYNRTLPVIVFVPCDTAKLAHSPALPWSIFDPRDQVFSDAEPDALLKKSGEIVADGPNQVPGPRLEYGFDLLRHNRVEGLSAAVDISQQIAP